MRPICVCTKLSIVPSWWADLTSHKEKSRLHLRYNPQLSWSPPSAWGSTFDLISLEVCRINICSASVLSANFRACSYLPAVAMDIKQHNATSVTTEPIGLISWVANFSLNWKYRSFCCLRGIKSDRSFMTPKDNPKTSYNFAIFVSNQNITNFQTNELQATTYL